jgi:hypothetical protein
MDAFEALSRMDEERADWTLRAFLAFAGELRRRAPARPRTRRTRSGATSAVTSVPATSPRVTPRVRPARLASAGSRSPVAAPRNSRAFG